MKGGRKEGRTVSDPKIWETTEWWVPLFSFWVIDPRLGVGEVRNPEMLMNTEKMSPKQKPAFFSQKTKKMAV